MSAIDSARRLVDEGYSVIPLAAGTKVPLRNFPVTQYRSRQPDSSELFFWLVDEGPFHGQPDANLAVQCGYGGLCVLDADDREAARALVDWAPEDAPVVETHRGVHVWCRVEGRPPPSVPKTLEVFDRAHYVVAPESVVRGKDKTTRRPYVHTYQFERPLVPAHRLPPFDAQRLAHLFESLSPRREEVEKALARESILSCSTALGPSLERELVAHPAFVRAAMPLLGIPDVRIGTTFLCPLPGHEEVHPSASLFTGEDGLTFLRDWHVASGKAWFTLAEVYASRRYGRVVELSPLEQVIWTRRLAVETGFLTPSPVPHRPLPPEASESAASVYEGFLLLVALRQDLAVGAATPFTWRFGSAWTRLSQPTVGDAMRRLLREGFIRQAGQHRRTALFLPVC